MYLFFLNAINDIIIRSIPNDGESPIVRFPRALNKNARINVFFFPRRSPIAPVGISPKKEVVIITDSKIPIPA